MKHAWNHKRVRRVYRAMGLRLTQRKKKRLPARVKQPFSVPAGLNESGSADFMSDQHCGGRRFRTFNVMDDFNRQVLAVEVDTLMPSSRVIRSMDRLKQVHGLSKRIRVDNGPAFRSNRFTQ